jgi:hypothetical protein
MGREKANENRERKKIEKERYKGREIEGYN